MRAFPGSKLVRIAALALFASCGAPTTPPPLPPCDTSARMPDLEGRDTVKVLAVGDIADCPSGAQMAVSQLALDLRPDATFALGDLAYPNGSLDDYLGCYGPSFGRLRSITRAVPGNHDYHTVHAGAYYSYFCGSSGEPFKGYYSFDVGKWHVVALNSNCGQDPDVPEEVVDDFGGCGAESPQLAWLRDDIALHPTGCRMAMWHHPRYSQSSEGPSPAMGPAWRVLAAAGFDLVVNGHAHNYQRYAPMDGDGAIDDAGGIRELVVGTGGSPFSGFDDDRSRSEIRNGDTHGLLELDLAATSYRWRFRGTDGAFTDEGGARCHR